MGPKLTMVDVYVKRAFAIDPRSPPTSIETRVKLNRGYVVSSKNSQAQTVCVGFDCLISLKHAMASYGHTVL